MDCVPLLPPHDSIAMRAVLNRFFLPVRLGGDDFINSEATREAAYAASMIYCGPMMRNAVLTSLLQVSKSCSMLRDLCAHRAFNVYQQWTLPFSEHFPCNPAYRSAFTVSWLRIDALLRWHLFLLVNHGTVLVSFVPSQQMNPPFDDRELLI